MSHFPGSEKISELEFRWGKKGGIGGQKRDVQFYESFFYDGMEYKLCDSVYMYNEKEPEPYVGKIVKIWETSIKFRKVKIHWFFRPSEISCYLRDENVLENELFLASGDGRGLANINPLEAIAGKCNVVCISKDSRNPQPTVEELQMADYVFYRVFDVARCKILDKLEDEVGGLDVKFVFNKIEFLNSLNRNYSLEKFSSPQNTNFVVVGNVNHVIKDAPEKSVHCQISDLEVARNLGSLVEVEIKEKFSRADDHWESKLTKRSKNVDLGLPFTDHDESGSLVVSEMKKSDSQKEVKPDVSSKYLEDNKKSVFEETKGNFGKKTRLQKELPMREHKGSMFKSSNTKGVQERKPEVKFFQVTKRPVAEKANWIKLTWEERIKTAQEAGKLVLLQNLDPSYTSGEIEDIIWHAFEEECTVKVVQHVTTMNPYYGQAFSIFNSRKAVDKVLRRLDERCLILPNQRPLIARVGDLSKYLDNKKAFFGHLSFDKVKRQMQRELREAVSTYHFSQYNTVEFDMAMAWWTQQLKFDRVLKALFEQQHVELKKLKDNLKVT